MNLIATLSDNPFFEFTIIIFLAAVLGVIGQKLRQPLIVMFIALGIVVGPSVLDIVRSEENIHLLAEIGIAILLFIVGLKLDLRVIKSLGKIALYTGLGQIGFTSLFGYFIGLSLGFSSLHSFYIAIALTFSSTIIIVKLLSDKKEIDSLHGQIAVGFLIVQDIAVILIMIVLSAMQESDNNLGVDIVKTIGAGFFLMGLTLAAMKWVLPKLSRHLAKSQEMLILFAIGWALTLASIGELLNFSSEVGAFLAGVSLASSEYKDVISSRLISIRDFLLLFFFVNLGANLDLSLLGQQVTPALVFSVFVLVGNPIIVLIIMGIMGYRKRTSFLAGLTVAQISEFSLIFAGLGLSVGHITEEIVGLITLVGLITIASSTYLILYSHQIFELISGPLSIFQRKNPHAETEIIKSKKNYDLIIIGLGRFGRPLIDMLEEHPNVKYLGIDFDPEIVAFLREKGKDVIYGDMEDPEFLDKIPFEKTKFVISTVPYFQHSEQLIKALRRENYKGKIFLTALNEKDLEDLKDSSADTILFPHHMAAVNFYNAYLLDSFRQKDDE